MHSEPSTLIPPQMTPDDTRNFFQQEDDAWSRAIELALTPVVAAGIGYLIDRVVGTEPIFTIVFLVLAVVGTFVKMYYAYDTKMKAHDAESPWGRAQTRSARPDGAGQDGAGQDGAGPDAAGPDGAGPDAAGASTTTADHVAAQPGRRRPRCGQPGLGRPGQPPAMSQPAQPAHDPRRGPRGRTADRLGHDPPGPACRPFPNADRRAHLGGQRGALERLCRRRRPGQLRPVGRHIDLHRAHLPRRDDGRRHGRLRRTPGAGDHRRPRRHPHVLGGSSYPWPSPS